MRLPLRWFVVLVSFLLATTSIPAFAGNPLGLPEDREACKHLDHGNNLYETGSFAGAIVEYKAGAVIEPAAVFDYNLGQAHRQLGKYREALWHYDRFLHKGQPTGELRDAVIAFIAEMRAHLENKAQTMPPTGPEPSSKTSYSLGTREQSASDPPTGRVHLEPSTRPTDHVGARDWLGWSLTGSGVIAVAISGGLLYQASQLNNQGDSETEMRARRSLYDQASSRNLAAVIVGIGGVALVAGGIVRLTLHHRSPSQTSAINIGINGRGLFAAGSF